MAKIYANLIKKGLKTLEDVREELREQVKALLEKEQQIWAEFYLVATIK